MNYDIFGQNTTLSSPITSADWANVAGAFFCMILFAVLVAAFMVFLFHRIFKRAGYNGWLGFLALIPGIGELICLCVLAFDAWPAKKKEERSVRCVLPGYGEGTFIPDAAPAPAPFVPPAPPAPESSVAPVYAPVAPAPEPAPEPAAPLAPEPVASPEPAAPPAPEAPEPVAPPAPSLSPAEGGSDH